MPTNASRCVRQRHNVNVAIPFSLSLSLSLSLSHTLSHTFSLFLCVDGSLARQRHGTPHIPQKSPEHPSQHTGSSGSQSDPSIVVLVALSDAYDTRVNRLQVCMIMSTHVDAHHCPLGRRWIEAGA